MLRPENVRRHVNLRCNASLALLACLSLMLTACLLSPGKFTSQLDLKRDGSFSFNYVGEIHLLALSKLAAMGRGAGSDTFKPEPCKVEGSDAVRTCTQREIADEKSAWTASRSSGAEKRRRDAESMKAMLGGIDPTDPRAAEDLAVRLRRQAGWRSVTYKGEGLFDVDFSISGRLNHDFSFPTIERFPMANAFVQIALRNDGTVRVDAPGYAAAMSGEPWRSMMAGAAASEAGKDGPQLPVVDGRFTVTTDGTVLANNTDEGPQKDAAGQRLDWTISVRSTAPPMALIRLRP
jgi:hypothetical protein